MLYHGIDKLLVLEHAASRYAVPQFYLPLTPVLKQDDDDKKTQIEASLSCGRCHNAVFIFHE